MVLDAVTMMIGSAGRSKLLTRQEEIIYCQRIQAWVKIKAVQSKFALEFDREPTIAEIASAIDQPEATVQRTIVLGEHARERVIKSNLRLVISNAKKYLDRGIEYADLIQEGNLGLETAAGKFDPTRGYKFSTYATFWIKQRIRRAIALKSKTVRLPIHITEKLNKIKKAQRELSQESGQRPTILQIEARLGWKPNKVTQVLLLAQPSKSLDQLVGGNRDNQDTPFGELLPSPFGDPLEVECARERRALLLEAMQRLLTDEERNILDRSFGFSGAPQKQEEIGNQMNLSRDRVRQIKSRALRKLRVNDPRLKELL